MNNTSEDNRIKLLDDSPYKEVRQHFIEGGGQIAVALLGMLNRVCGQIYGLLFLSPSPLSLDDIVEELGVSKGNVSINIRLLEDFKLVRKVWIKGSRKDYYEAVDMIPEKIIRGFFDKINRSIQDSLDMIKDCHELALKAQKNHQQSVPQENEFVIERLSKIRSFYENAHLLFSAIYSGEKIDLSFLKPLLKSEV